MNRSYVHGYEHRECRRLQDQASTLIELLHSDTAYPAGARVLEAGCGVGAQTVVLAQNSPDALIVCVDISPESLQEAQKKTAAAGLTNVSFHHADLFRLPDELGLFDHIFVCFVLEHLAQPAAALRILKSRLRAGGTITAIEGDHGSVFFHPESAAAHRAIQCQVELQRRAGGNAMLGRELYPLLQAAGFHRIRVSPRLVYVDSSKPELVDGFTKKTFTAMIEGVRRPAIDAGLIEPDDFDRGVRGLYRAAESDGVFCYTFFKAVAEND